MTIFEDIKGRLVLHRGVTIIQFGGIRNKCKSGTPIMDKKPWNSKAQCVGLILEKSEIVPFLTYLEFQEEKDRSLSEGFTKKLKEMILPFLAGSVETVKAEKDEK